MTLLSSPITTLKLKNGNGPLKVKVDMGAKCNVISKRMLNSFDHNIPINTQRKSILWLIRGEAIDTEGMQCILGQFKFHVVDQDVNPLLSLQVSIATGLIQLGPGVHMLQCDAPEVHEYRDLFYCYVIGSLLVVHHETG